MSNEKFKQKNKVVVKVGLVGDSQIGKTTLMVKYIEDQYDEDYIETLGVNFMEKSIHLKNVEVTISIWDLGGQREFATLMPLVCSEAKAILFIFDLTQQPSLYSVKRWYKEAKKENKSFMPFLIGTKFDLFVELEPNEKECITRQARKFAKKMKAPLIFCSSKTSINIKKIFKVIIAKVFDLKPKMKEIQDEEHDALLELDPTDDKTEKKKSKKKNKNNKENNNTNNNDNNYINNDDHIDHKNENMNIYSPNANFENINNKKYNNNNIRHNLKITKQENESNSEEDNDNNDD